MSEVQELQPSQLAILCDLSKFSCETTADLVPLDSIIGQNRAVKALRFGLAITDNRKFPPNHTKPLWKSDRSAGWNLKLSMENNLQKIRSKPDGNSEILR